MTVRETPATPSETRFMDRPLFLVSTLAALTAVGSPVFAADAFAVTLDEVALANRILAHENVVDGFGHVSVRDPRDATRYLLARSMAPALVTSADILTYSIATDEPIDAQGRVSYLERFIHGGIYRARPDLNAVVHSHTQSVIPFGVSQVPLRPIFHMAAFLGGNVPIFEIRETAGDATNLLVSSQVLGDALARTLGASNVALMRGHGMVAVAGTLHEAVFRAYYTGRDAEIESEALRLGNPTFLSPGEAKAATATQAGLVDRSWELWKTGVTQN
jgi:HCOMODA/2-hydroxy-3-carboxy-muconic semialdehyde decarboxylase